MLFKNEGTHFFFRLLLLDIYVTKRIASHVAATSNSVTNAFISVWQSLTCFKQRGWSYLISLLGFTVTVWAHCWEHSVVQNGILNWLLLTVLVLAFLWHSPYMPELRHVHQRILKKPLGSFGALSSRLSSIACWHVGVLLLLPAVGVWEDLIEHASS